MNNKINKSRREFVERASLASVWMLAGGGAFTSWAAIRLKT
jgi:hypothetical protein